MAAFHFSYRLEHSIQAVGGIIGNDMSENSLFVPLPVRYSCYHRAGRRRRVFELVT